VTTALLDALAASAEARAARRWIWFGYFEAPGLAEAIGARGGTVARYRYMRCPLGGTEQARQHGPLLPRARAWRAADARQLAALLASAYFEDDQARPFAPTGRTEEWHEYVVQLLATGGCGIFDPRLSLVAGPDAGALDAAALVTLLSPRTAHLAQLVVRRDAQANGLGAELLAGALALSSARGCTELTLLVHEQNAAALRLYERAGFTSRAAFLSAVQPADQPRTSSSEALATGGVRTRR
jgi:ribosomal protein S18 acetylase RimI-like enzyme